MARFPRLRGDCCFMLHVYFWHRYCPVSRKRVQVLLFWRSHLWRCDASTNWLSEWVFECTAFDELVAPIRGMRSFARDTIAAGGACGGPTVHAVACRAKFSRYNVVQYRLEVVEEDCVGCTLEDECEPPIRIDAATSCNLCCADCHIREQEGNRECHAKQHDAKAGIDPNQCP